MHRNCLLAGLAIAALATAENAHAQRCTGRAGFEKAVLRAEASAAATTGTSGDVLAVVNQQGGLARKGSGSEIDYVFSIGLPSNAVFASGGVGTVSYKATAAVPYSSYTTAVPHATLERLDLGYQLSGEHFGVCPFGRLERFSIPSLVFGGGTPSTSGIYTSSYSANQASFGVAAGLSTKLSSVVQWIPSLALSMSKMTVSTSTNSAAGSHLTFQPTSTSSISPRLEMSFGFVCYQVISIRPSVAYDFASGSGSTMEAEYGFALALNLGPGSP